MNPAKLIGLVLLIFFSSLGLILPMAARNLPTKSASESEIWPQFLSMVLYILVGAIWWRICKEKKGRDVFLLLMGWAVLLIPLAANFFWIWRVLA